MISHLAPSTGVRWRARRLARIWGACGVMAGCVDVVPEQPASDANQPQAALPIPPDPRTYERTFTFVGGEPDDEVLVVPWIFSATPTATGVDRRIRGWLGRRQTWDPFFEESWTSEPTRSPWRILPRGPVRLVVGSGDAVEAIVYEEGVRQLEVTTGSRLAEWSGARGESFLVHEGAASLTGQVLDGFVVESSRAWASPDRAPGDWMLLVSGDSLQIVVEEPVSGSPAGFRGWARYLFRDLGFPDIDVEWTEVLAYEPARRDVPVELTFASQGGELEGRIRVLSSHLEAGQGTEPLLPVHGLLAVSGSVTLEGRPLPVLGFLRHHQR